MVPVLPDFESEWLISQRTTSQSTWWSGMVGLHRVSILFEAYGDESEAYHFELT